MNPASLAPTVLPKIANQSQGTFEPTTTDLFQITLNNWFTRVSRTFYRSILQLEAHDETGALPITLFGSEAERVTNIKSEKISTMQTQVQDSTLRLHIHLLTDF